MLTDITRISKIYDIEEHLVIDCLTEAVRDNIELKDSEEIELFFNNELMIFRVRDNEKKSLEMGKDSGQEHSIREIDLTKNERLYNTILKIFEMYLQNSSLNQKFIKMKNNVGEIVEAKITKVSKNGFFAETKYGNVYCPGKNQIDKEMKTGLYQEQRILKVEILTIKMKNNKVEIYVTRKSKNIYLDSIARNFENFPLIYCVKRMPSKYTKLFLDRNISIDDIKKLRYIFGGERIIVKVQ